MNEHAARKDYENDVARRPTYHDGSTRKSWEQLSDIAKYSWMHPHARPYPLVKEPFDMRRPID